MKLLTPQSLDEALRQLADAHRAGQAITPLAGGTDVLVSWHHRPKTDLTLMDLSRITGLDAMVLTPTDLHLGPMTTYWQVIRSAEASEAFPLLAEAARQVGAIQIQTRGTWAGNIANGSPAADGVPVLMVYDAVVELGSQGGRREVPLHEYYTGYRRSVRLPDEIITGIRVPRRRRDVEWFHKVGARRAQAITKVGAALVHDDAGWRVAANSVAPVVCRCGHLEKALDAGKPFARPEELEALLRNDVSPIDDLRSTARYRLRVLSRLLHSRLFAENACHWQSNMLPAEGGTCPGRDNRT